MVNGHSFARFPSLHCIIFLPLLVLFFFLLSYFSISIVDGSESNATNTRENRNGFINISRLNFVDIPHNSSLNLKTFTISIWFHTTTNFPSGIHFLVNKGGMGSEKPGQNLNYGIWMDGRERINGGFETVNGENNYIRTNQSYNDGKWHHVALAFNGSILGLYLDKVQVTNKSSVALPDYTGNKSISIGVNSQRLDDFFTGSLDELRIFNRGLTSREIEQQYNTRLSSADGQVLYFLFN
jgi:Concanavalin A-like lectin/glucanases superfamily